MKPVILKLIKTKLKLKKISNHKNVNWNDQTQEAYWKLHELKTIKQNKNKNESKT